MAASAARSQRSWLALAICGFVSALSVSALSVSALSVSAQSLDHAALQQADGTATTGISPRRPWSTSRLRGAPDPPPPYRVKLAFEGLKFHQPVVITSAPGRDELFVAEQSGSVYSFSSDRKTTQRELLIDLKQLHPEMTAIYGLAFHPRFAENGEVFICYVLEDKRVDGSRVSRFRMREDGLRIDPASEQVVITWLAGGHNGGCIKFGHDGCLYITTGDGASPSPPDPLNAGQDVTNLLSSILRIDIDHTDDGRAYRIPADNPFVNVSGARGEIYAFGFRNPWKMSFDRATGDLWVGDVGWELWEMIDRVQKGGNYGWSIVEGDQPVRPGDTPGPSPILTPTLKHSHSEAASITGGFVYRGTALPELVGTYLYGDYQSGIFWGARLEGDRVIWHKELAHSPLQLVGFGEDNQGELYVLDYRGEIYELVANDEPDTSGSFPFYLSETGLFSSLKELTPSPGVIPYRINSIAWADYSVSQRWLALPGDLPLRRDRRGRWQYPDGTVIAKQINMPMVAGKPESQKRLELQVLVRESERWRPYTYLWNEAQTDAQLVGVNGTEFPLSIDDPNAPQGVRKQTWRVHGRKECVICHNPWVEQATANFGIQSASPLAMNLEQLDAPSLAGDGRQLDQWRHHGWLATRDGERVQPLANPYDETADLHARARAYLSTNCSHCHQFNAGGTATILLSHNVDTSEMKLIDVAPTQGTFGISDAKLVASGDPAGSVLLYRLSKTGGGRMPRVGSREVDRQATAMLRRWIERLPTDVQTESPPAALARWADVVADPTSAAAQTVIAQAAATTRGALHLLGIMESPETPAAVRAAIVAVCGKHDTPEVRDLFEAYLPSSERIQRLGAVVNIEAILQLPADAERGQKLFAGSSVNCKNCHRIGELGTSIGPALDQIGKKYDQRQLLQNILEPSRFMEPQYVPYVLETHDGLVLTGLISEQSDMEVAIRDATNKLHRVAHADIASLTRQTISLMPELLLSELTAEQVADLVAYLSTLKQ